MDIEQWAKDTVEQWATYDGCPCSKARRSHAEFITKRMMSRDIEPDITARFDDELVATNSGASFEYQATLVIGVLRRLAESLDDRIFGIIHEIDRLLQPPAVQEEWSDMDERHYQYVLRLKADGERFLVSVNMEPIRIDDILDEMSRRRSTALAANAAGLDLTNALGSSTIEIVKKVELLDREKFDKWLGAVKEAVSLLYKENKTADDIFEASSGLSALMTGESTKAFLRMLDSGLLGAVADKIDKVRNGVENATEEKGEEDHTDADYFEGPGVSPVRVRRDFVEELSARLHDEERKMGIAVPSPVWF